MIILAETGRIPVDNPSGHVEIAMIDESRTLEYSGRGAALLRWGSAIKFMVLSLVLVNVLVTPWGLAADAAPVSLLRAAASVLAKVLLFDGAVAVIEMSLAKLRLFRIEDYLGVAFVIAVLSLLVQPIPP